MASAEDIQNAQFPTLDRLQATLSDDLDPLAAARAWFAPFSKALGIADVPVVSDSLLPNVFWRDILALTWDFRTLYAYAVRSFLTDRLPGAKIACVVLDEASVALQRPYPDIAYIHMSFTFTTVVGFCSGIARIVPTSSGTWKAHTVFTNLEDLIGHPERIGTLREQAQSHGKWFQKRQREIECEGEDEQPQVVIIGAGQSGLEVAARLKYLGIKVLVIEKEARIGHLWRTRYEALCLHNTVWLDHMPYLPFPSTWPVFAPAPKIAAWLEHYAFDLELNVWTSATLLSVVQDPDTHLWTLDVARADGSRRTLRAGHLVGAVGIGGGKHYIPTIPGMDEYTGAVLHSGEFTSAREYAGKKAVVIGACTSAHDVCQDFYDHGIDVTMVQRSSTYVMSVKHGVTATFNGLYNEKSDSDVSDRIVASFPIFSNKELLRRNARAIAQIDKDILDGLKKVGFRTNMGVDDTGLGIVALARAGGYYFDTGTSSLVAAGKIKLKNDSTIARFTPTGLAFADGSVLDADVVLFATGYGSVNERFREILGDTLADKLVPLWDLDAEGELRGVWRGTGVPRFYCMLGNFAMCRFHSKHVALQIKAMEEGLWDGTRYSRED
ncbi:hypothetical protein K488DRAFT_49948 [Vararia minispora EC-137]|uniref:Uncharacterized protein n=1 Tax=Vararia minispora EC-137 TaxID=1314806 RepID=A0ACB8QKT3_9AGAM|nr:hypothetical protein K488DRAFT_49948 [Vararia minispora EC-137]